MLQLESDRDYEPVVWLELPEMGCVGWARVVNQRTFQYTPGVGNLVTGTFRHISDDVIDLTVEGQDKPIGVTNSHPFWSVDRQEFVPAGELLQGERLLLFSGDTARVTQKLPRPGPHVVYNIEVFGEHVYQVTLDGVVVHNHCGERLKLRKSTIKAVEGAYTPEKNKVNLLTVQHDMGHETGLENRRLIKIWNKWQQEYPDLDFSKKKWRNFYNMPVFYRVEDHLENISHLNERKGSNLQGLKVRILNMLGCESVEQLLERLEVPPKRWKDMFDIDVGF